jgi:hypothetical protein
LALLTVPSAAATCLSCCCLHAWPTGILLLLLGLLLLAYDQVLAVPPQVLVWLQAAAECVLSQHTPQHLRQQQSATPIASQQCTPTMRVSTQCRTQWIIQQRYTWMLSQEAPHTIKNTITCPIPQQYTLTSTVL